MSLNTWQAQHSGTLFAIVDGALDRAAVSRFYELSQGEAFPLFAGTEFDEQVALGPWLLSNPSPAFVADSPALSGFYLVSEQSLDVVRHHWQSLILAIREGEAVWFRFSEPRIFLPMFCAMSPEEQDAVLGPCNGIWINDTGFTRNPDTPFHPPLKSPWFHIRPPHLAALYDDDRHAYILRRRLWQTMTSMMARHPEPAGAILSVLRQANAEKLQEDVLDGVVAGALALQVGLPLESIRAPLMLTEAEFAQVNHWMVQHNALIGVN
ncbi:DUF4123 domain-containing protein [Pectobacterium brasiliense]|nr:DUF4123 domain-containing protein [Pectobacterium brasiliense]MBA0196665.1 DUF4123 domain-containing protein [Pectobacterium brasiliense]MBN3092914.1 DUF4123 domain-containing protein [Pectobacterium brasiliense]MBN3131176.1 DUF4123 domain-containing protein [Pectobacterium brasiliense]MBN3141436.1 DUF4123 domain-containing protein [Pectobacterium brasiliense]MBW5896800.1 DUF4123 domain-containing protein [Pectobacterium brasiliense]